MILFSFQCIVNSHPSYLNKPHFTLHFFSSARQTQINCIIPTSDHLLNKHQFSLKTASKVSSVLPHLRDPEKADSVLSFLKESGLSETQLEQVVEKRPKILCSELESSIKPKIKIFQDYGFSPADVAEFISDHPRILNRSPDANQLKQSLLLLREVLGSNFSVSHLLKYKVFLHRNSEKDLRSNVEFLQSCGISLSQVKLTFGGMYLSYLKPETLKQVAKRVDEMGVSRESKMFFHGLRTVGKMTAENWEHKLDLFRNIGFSEDEIVSAFRRFPSVFAVSERKIKGMTEVLLGSGMYNISFIVSHPQIFIFSIERTIKPRVQVMKILKRKNLKNAKATTYVYRLSEKKFIASYVLPFVDRASELLGMVNEAKDQLKVVEGSVEE